MAPQRIALAAVAFGVAACSHQPPAVPAALAPASDSLPRYTVAATGVQIYECRRSSDGSGAGWVFVAPEAELFDGIGRHVGSHGAGPSWQALDGSRIVDKVQSRADAPVTGAIPWLLLSAQDAGQPGVLSRVTQVQRLNTRGGVAPPTGCTPERIGQSVRIAYTADYRFFNPRTQ